MRNDNHRTEYWMDADADFWADIVSKYSVEELFDYVRLLHSDMTDCVFHDDCGELGFLTWMDGRHCCSMSLDDPPHWFAIKLIREVCDERDK